MKIRLLIFYQKGLKGVPIVHYENIELGHRKQIDYLDKISSNKIR